MTIRLIRHFSMGVWLLCYHILPGFSQAITAIESTVDNKMKVKIEGLSQGHSYTLFYWEPTQPLNKLSLNFVANDVTYEREFTNLEPDKKAYIFQTVSSDGNSSNILGSIYLKATLNPIYNVLSFKGPEAGIPSVPVQPVQYDVIVYEDTITNPISGPTKYVNPHFFTDVIGDALRCRNFIYRAEVSQTLRVHGISYTVKSISNYALADRKGLLAKDNNYLLGVTYDNLRPNEFIELLNHDISSANLKHNFYVSTNDSNYTLTGNSSIRRFDFKVPNSNIQYCFKFEKELAPNCGVYSDLSPVSCSILLKLERGFVVRSGQISLNENKNTRNIYDYLFYFSDGFLNQSLNSTLPFQDFSRYIPNYENTGYVDIWVSGSGDYYMGTADNPKSGILFNYTSFSNRIRYYLQQDLLIPTAFSREGAGKDPENLSFKISLKYPGAPLKGGYSVFDHWGKPVYQTNDVKAKWNGTLADGSIIVPGNYVVKAHASIDGGKVLEKNGTLTIF